jgi:hypothetical protein
MRKLDAILASLLRKELGARVLHAEGEYRTALDHLLPVWRAKPPQHTHLAGKTTWSLIVECAFALDDLDLVREMLEPVLALRPGQTAPSIAARDCATAPASMHDWVRPKASKPAWPRRSRS